MSPSAGGDVRLSASNRFLLDCVRSLTDRGPDRIEPAESPTWPDVLQAARRHQVEPALYEAIRDTPLERQLTDEQRRTLLLAYHRTGLRNLHIGQRVATILQEAERRGLELLLLKGAVLARQAYAKPEHRPLDDVDLLVRESDFGLLREMLEGLGYRTRMPALTARELPDYAQCFRQIRFAARVPPALEVHFRLLNLGLPATEEPAWSDARAVDLGGALARIPSPERFLLHLCLHAQQHGFAVLRLLVDVAVWLDRSSPDAEAFVRLARRENLSSTAFYALRYTAELLGVDAAAQLAGRLHPSRWKRRLLDRLHDDAAVRSLAIGLRATESELPRAYLFSDAPLRHKMRFALRVLAPPAAWLDSAGQASRWSRRGRHWGRILRAGLAGNARD